MSTIRQNSVTPEAKTPIEVPGKETPLQRKYEEQKERLFLSGPQPRLKELFRAVRIFMEILRGFRTLHFIGPCVTVFGSARFKENEPEYSLAKQVGEELARSGFTVITGGGPGLMEAANRGAREAGGYSVGCNIHLPVEQKPNAYLDLFIEFKHFFVRKLMLAKYSYAFIALPGGFGTLDELFEVATLVQTGKIKGFPIVLMGSEYWSPLIRFMKTTLVDQGTISLSDFERITVSDSPSEVASRVRASGLKEFGLTYDQPKQRWYFFERARFKRRL